MLIGIDGNEANIRNRVGSNRYAYELLWAMYKWQSDKVAELQSQDTPGVGPSTPLRASSPLPERRENGLQFKIYLKQEPLGDLPKEKAWWQYRVVGPKRFWTQFGLPLDLYLHQPRPDIFFTPGHYLPRWSPCPTAMSILDLAYINFPDMFRKRDLWQLKRWTARSVKGASRILTISQSSRNDIISHYKLSPKKVVVTYPGFKVMAKNNNKAKLKRYGVRGDFILYVGTLQPRKNLLRLIEAFKLFSNSEISLVIVGKKGWLYEEIFQKVKKLGLGKKVIFTGFVPDKDLPVFYQNALCFVLISLYEGFGIPVLEAMHYGCPVVASNVSSLPEIVGKAGVLVDPESIDDIAAGVKKAIKDKKKLVKKGYQQVKKFSWEKCARETLKVLEEVDIHDKTIN